MRKENGSVWALGLMSGTSLDGIDAALIKTDGSRIGEFGPWLTMPYEESFRARLREAVHVRGDMLKLEHELTLRHADAVHSLLKQAGMDAKDIRLIGFHGQTVSHRPAEGITWQLGNGALLAEKTKIDVICDFRRHDVAAGGQGAPLVPLYHAALTYNMELPVAVLNIGGVANVTWIGRSESPSDDLLDLDILAFDTGPGNALLNDWAHTHTGEDCDRDGKLALAGKVSQSALAALLANDYFSITPPKSLDRNHFLLAPIQLLSAEDGAATLTEFTASSVKKAALYFPMPARHWYICGGGCHNPALMQAIKNHFPQVSMASSLGWIGDALEAQAFAFLGVRSLHGQPLSLPTTTGAIRAVTGGALCRA